MGSTSIQRGWSRPVANALTLSPGAAIGFCPSLHPLAVGIFSVGIAPCGFAAGTTGALPQAGTCGTPCSRRHSSAAPPITATIRAKMLEIVDETPLDSAALYTGGYSFDHAEFSGCLTTHGSFSLRDGCTQDNTPRKPIPYSSVKPVNPSRGAAEQRGLFIR